MSVCNENNLYTHQLTGSVAPTRLGLSQALEEAREFVGSAALPELTRYQFLIVVEELITNIVTHGSPPERTTVDYEFCRIGDAVRICVSDSGAAFDPMSLPEQPANTVICTDKEGGWGWRVILKWCALEDYRRDGDRNHVSLLLDPSRSGMPQPKS